MIEKLMEIAIREAIKDGSFIKGPDCLSFNQIGNYIEGKCSGDELEGILDHLVDCLYCGRLGIKIRRLLEEEATKEIEDAFVEVTKKSGIVELITITLAYEVAFAAERNLESQIPVTRGDDEERALITKKVNEEQGVDITAWILPDEKTIEVRVTGANLGADRSGIQIILKDKKVTFTGETDKAGWAVLEKRSGKDKHEDKA